MKFLESPRFLLALSLITFTFVAALTLAIGFVLTRQAAAVEGVLAATLALLVGAVVLVVPLVLLAGYRYHRASSAELRANEERFRSTFEQAAVGIAHVAPNGDFLRINDRFCEIVGYTSDEMLARTFQDITHPDDLEADLEHVQLLLRGEVDTYSISKRYLRKDGQIVWVNLTVSLLRDDTGDPRWFVSVVENITKRKLAEEALQKSEKRFRDIADNSLAWIWEVDSNGKYTYVSPVVESILGYKPEEILQKHFYDLFCPDDKEELKRAALEGFAGKMEFREFINRNVHKNGKEVWLSTSGVPVIDETGELVGYRGADTDITERKHAEDALRENEHRHRTLLESLPQKIFLKDRDSVYIYCNEKLALDLGIMSEEIAGKSDFDFFPRALAEKYRADDKRLIEAERTEELEEPYARHGKTEWVRTVKTPVRDDKGTVVGILGIFWDITEKKQAENTLLKYQQRLKALASELTVSEEQERRRIALDLHDQVGQSLSAARVQLATAKKATTDTDLAADLDEISQSLLQAVQDTRDIMYDLSSPSIDEFGLDAAISEWMEVRIASRHGLTTEFTADEMKTPLDDDTRAIVFRCVRELLTNVVKHARASRVAVRMISKAETLRVAVEDDGVGFDATGAADADSGGGGFGLFSIQERMGDLGGELEIKSRPGAGCTAVLRVPIQPL
jgi:PAS domain S-box-containing protein